MTTQLRIEQTTSSQAAPINDGEFTALIAPFSHLIGTQSLALAVSGGPDSMALAFCVRRWLAEQKDKRTLIAFIVDHDLRHNSAAEAGETQANLARIGIEAEILRWQHSPVVRRLHETARKARRQLLVEACRRHQIPTLMLAHQRDDQAETILMRFAKGSGIDGLSGMRACDNRDGVAIMRPFLNIPKERLVATCVDAGLSFVIDPSNSSEKFARGRLRRVTPLLETEGFTTDRLIGLGARAREAKDAIDHAASMLLRVAARRDDSGTIEINLEHLRSAPTAVAQRALKLCLHHIHPQDYPAQHEAVSRLIEMLRRDQAVPAQTLYGCLIGKNSNSAWIMREYGSVTEDLPINPGKSVVWDSRWCVTLSEESSKSYIIKPLGNPSHDTLDRLAPGLRRMIPQGRRRACLPALWLNGALGLIPALPSAHGESIAKTALIGDWPANYR